MRPIALLIALTLGTADPALAQDPFNLTAPVRNLATMFTDLFGPNGLIVDSLATLPGEQPHSAHFNSDFQSNASQFTTALVGQLVSLPLPSPAGGFTYEFDSTLGVFRRTTESFGPIVADRAETIGARRVAVGFAYQRFAFDTIEGMDLRSIPAVFTHDSAHLLGGREDVVTTVNQISARVTQSTAFVTMGVTDVFDLSLAVPVVSNQLKVVSTATIHRLGTTNALTHFYRQAAGAVGDSRMFTAVGSAAGLGDLMVRVKSTVRKSARSGVALGVDLRLPTGDEMNLLGSGATGIQPFAIWSATFRTVSPHVNAGYNWNGSSILAGDPARGESADFPDQITYAAGADVSVSPRLTVAFEVLGRYMIDAERLHREQFAALDGRSVFPSVGFSRTSFNVLNGAIGLKAAIADRLLFDVNLTFNLNERGLRDKVTPLVGFEYAF
ncbi:MAG TPA: hypothetical protein VMO26_08885 [Vicinamibacterales bacterium]|nr:hypothetical protein [Vicinamibacterales bacterium]